MNLDPVIAGALFDFLGYLTTLKEPLKLGSACNAVPAVDALQSFAEKRGLSLDNPEIREWRSRVGSAQNPHYAQRVESAGSPTMDEHLAREILGDALSDDEGARLTRIDVLWINESEFESLLEGRFTADQLEAIAWLMRH